MTDKTAAESPVKVALELPPSLYQTLETLASEHQTTLNQTILEALTAYVEGKPYEDSDAEIKASLLEAWDQLHRGVVGRPIADVLADLADE